MSAENHTTTERVFSVAMQTLWADDVVSLYTRRTGHEKSNSRAYSDYLNLIYATCAAHAPRRFCQTIRVFYRNAEKLGVNGKKTFVKWPTRILFETKPYGGHYS